MDGREAGQLYDDLEEFWSNDAALDEFLHDRQIMRRWRRRQLVQPWATNACLYVLSHAHLHQIEPRHAKQILVFPNASTP